MPVSNATVGQTWSILVSGPTTISSTIESFDVDFELAIASSAPSEDTLGMKARCGEAWCFTLNAGENLYGKIRGNQTVANAVINS